METLVYPQHRLFEPFRELAERSPLKVIQTQFGTGVEFTPVFIPTTIQHYLLGEHIDTESDPGKRAQDFWYTEGGLNTLSHLKTWPGRIENRGIRLGLPAHESSPYCPLNAYETIGFGAGTLRPGTQTFNGFRASLEQEDGHSPHAVQIDSSEARRSSYLVLDYASGGNEQQLANQKYQSSNIIMPEVFGELRQLYARRDEKDLQDAYLEQLVRCCTKTEFEVTYPPGLSRPGTNTTVLYAPPGLKDMWASYAAAHLEHLNNGFYRELPKTRSQLIERVEDLLSRISIDSSPVFR